jgi:hypothetical protein
LKAYTCWYNIIFSYLKLKSREEMKTVHNNPIYYYDYTHPGRFGEILKDLKSAFGSLFYRSVVRIRVEEKINRTTAGGD